jgi:hypothetical protein
MPNINQTVQKIENFAHLPYGWRFGEGLPISRDKINAAILLVEHAESQGITRANAFAGAEGELSISFYVGENSIELVLEADGSITFAEDRKGEQINFVENLSLEDAYDKIWTFSNPSQNTLELSIHEIITRKQGNSTASLLDRRRMGEYRSSKEVVRYIQARASATTSHNITQIRPERQKSTGIFHQKVSRQAVA